MRKLYKKIEKVKKRKSEPLDSLIDYVNKLVIEKNITHQYNYSSAGKNKLNFDLQKHYQPD